MRVQRCQWPELAGAPFSHDHEDSVAEFRILRRDNVLEVRHSRALIVIDVLVGLLHERGPATLVADVAKRTLGEQIRAPFEVAPQLCGPTEEDLKEGGDNM